MISFKYKQNLYFANWFAEKMILRWKRPEVDCIIPVPLHPHRQKERGFNQTLEIAKNSRGSLVYSPRQMEL